MESERQRKRISLVGDIKDGSLKAPNLESIIQNNDPHAENRGRRTM